MDFTFYTLGDVEIFRAALTAAAMIFSPNGAFVGPVENGGLGLGLLSVFGLMVALMMLLIQGVLKQKLEFAEVLVMLAIFIALFVPKFRVQIEDYYDSGNIAAVDGVPLGIAFPAAMMSTVVRGINDIASTAYSTVNGGYYTNVMSPLRILNGFQKASDTLEGVDPLMALNLRTYVTYCLADREYFSQIKWKKLKVGGTGDSGFIDLLTTSNVVAGFTLWYNSDADGIGTPITCNDAMVSMNTRLNDWYSKEFGNIVNKTVLTASAKYSSKGAFGSNKAQPVTTEDYESAFVNLLGGGQELARNFALMTIFTPHINGSLECSVNTANPSDMKRCLSFQSITPQAAFDQAAAGSYFQRIMVFGMNALLFLWICLAPVVALVMLFTGARGIKIAGNYLLFGAWSQSWFIGAAIINFFIQKQLQYEMDINGGVANMTYDQFGTLANSIFTKIGLAGDMLSSVPLIMMAVMSGSAYAMTSMANRWGAGDRFDEKLSVPSVAQSAPIASLQSQMHLKHGGGGLAVSELYGTGRTWEMSSVNKWASQSTIQSQSQYAEKVSDGINNVLKEAYQHGNREQLMRQLSDTFGIADTNEARSALNSGKLTDFIHQAGNAKTTTNFERNGIDAHAGGGLNASPGITGAQTPKVIQGKDGSYSPLENGKPVMQPGQKVIGAGLDVGIKVGKSAGEQTDYRDSNTHTAGMATKVGSESGDGVGMQRKDGLDWSKVQAIGQFAESNYGKEMARQFGNEHSSVKSFIETGSITKGNEVMAGGRLSITSEELAQRIQKSEEAGAYLSERHIAMGTGQHAQEYQRAYQDSLIEFQGMGNATEELAQLAAMDTIAKQYGDNLAKEAVVNTFRMTTGSKMDVPEGGGSVKSDTFSPNIASRAGSRIAVAPNEKKAEQAKGAHPAGLVPGDKSQAQSDVRFVAKEGVARENVEKNRQSNNATVAKKDFTRFQQ